MVTWVGEVLGTRGEGEGEGEGEKGAADRRGGESLFHFFTHARTLVLDCIRDDTLDCSSSSSYLSLFAVVIFTRGRCARREGLGVRGGVGGREKGGGR